MTRVAYVSRSSVGHDERFRAAWRAAGCDVHAYVLPGRSIGASERGGLERFLRRTAPDLVQVGPVTDPAWDVISAWTGPLVATSWGFDLMDEVQQDDGVRDRVRGVLSRADLIFVDNNGPARVAAELGADPRRIRQFPWGVDGHWLEGPAVTDRLGSPSLILCTRRHDEMYRVADIVDAFADLAADHPQLRLTLAGSGPLTDSLRERVAAAGVDGRVDFLGDVPNELLPELLASADVYVSASAVDGTSVSLLEAMASGPAVVVSDIEGNRQWVDETTGWRFATGQPADLARVLRVVLATAPAERAERARAARRRIEQLADWRVTRARFAGFAEQLGTRA